MDADGLDINVANTRCPWDTSSKPSIALASIRILFVRLLLLSCFFFGNVAWQVAYVSPFRKEKQRVRMATRINYYLMIKWGSRRRSVGFTMGFLSFGLSSLCRMSACRFCCPNSDIMSPTCFGHVGDITRSYELDGGRIMSTNRGSKIQVWIHAQHHS